MHEVSLVQNMFEQVLNLMREHGACRVTEVKVLIGPFSGVVAESFAFAFDTLKQREPALTRAALRLERPAPRYLCLDCGAEADFPAAPDAPGLPEHRCPHCASRQLSPLGGNELLLQQIRMEET